MPGTELMTYQGFELMESTVITETGINVLINTSVHYTTGFHEVCRTVTLPQPANAGASATQYKLARSHLRLTAVEVLNFAFDRLRCLEISSPRA